MKLWTLENSIINNKIHEMGFLKKFKFLINVIQRSHLHPTHEAGRGKGFG